MAECKILFIAANPEGTSQLALDKEIREIDAKIRAAEFRDSLQLVSHWAVRPDDLLQFLNHHQPHVAHFSGHGNEELGFGRSVRQGFDQGKAALMLAGIREENIPELLCRSGVDPNDIILVQAATPASKPDSAKEKVMSDKSNRGVSIGGNVTGSAIVTGDHSVTSLQFTKTTLPPRSPSTFRPSLPLCAKP